MLAAWIMFSTWSINIIVQPLVRGSSRPARRRRGALQRTIMCILFDEVAEGDNKTAIGAEEDPGNSTQHLIWEGEGAQLFRSNIVSRVVRLEIDRVGGAPSDNQCSVQNNSPVSSVTYISWLRVPATGDDGTGREARWGYGGEVEQEYTRAK